ncbi:MAG: S41 family peptidase [Nitrospirae bacterium]|nr:S41 family peptidase [Nitrospirota bacterium]
MKLIACILLLTLCLASYAFADEKTVKYDPPTASYNDIQLLGNALSILQFVSMDDKEKKRFVYAALEGMTEALDRYSFFVPPEMIGSFIENGKDKYVGIGIQVARTDNNNIEIISVESDGPAFKAGIKPKDIIIDIDGRPVSKMRFIEAMRLLRAPGFSAGSKVALTILRDKDNRMDFVLAREFIKPKIIEWKAFEGNYGYIKIALFNKGTVSDFKKSIQEMEAKNGPLSGLIIDLRNNPGGDLDSCVEFSRLFIGSGVITSLDSNYPHYKVKFKADKEQTYKWPLVIIVDEGSASASELFAGALQFHKRAKVIGRKTFGKGTFQTLLPISDSTGLYITLGKYFMPDGRSVEGIGLTPDIIVESETEEEVVMDRAIQVLK